MPLLIRSIHECDRELASIPKIDVRFGEKQRTVSVWSERKKHAGPEEIVGTAGRFATMARSTFKK